MRPRRRILLALAAGTLSLLPACRKDVPVRVAEARYSELSVPVVCDGVLEPGPNGELRAPEAASVAEIGAREGERVESGRLLVRLSNRDLRERAVEARSAALALAADRESARAELARAQADLEQRRKTSASDEKLLAAGAISREERETGMAALREASSRLGSAKGRLDS